MCIFFISSAVVQIQPWEYVLARADRPVPTQQQEPDHTGVILISYWNNIAEVLCCSGILYIYPKRSRSSSGRR